MLNGGIKMPKPMDEILAMRAASDTHFDVAIQGAIGLRLLAAGVTGETTRQVLGTVTSGPLRTLLVACKQAGLEREEALTLFTVATKNLAAEIYESWDSEESVISPQLF